MRQLLLLLCCTVWLVPSAPAHADCCKELIPQNIACDGMEVDCTCACGGPAITITFTGGIGQAYSLDCMDPQGCPLGATQVSYLEITNLGQCIGNYTPTRSGTCYWWCPWDNCPSTTPPSQVLTDYQICNCT